MPRKQLLFCKIRSKYSLHSEKFWEFCVAAQSKRSAKNYWLTQALINKSKLIQFQEKKLQFMHGKLVSHTSYHLSTSSSFFAMKESIERCVSDTFSLTPSFSFWSSLISQIKPKIELSFTTKSLSSMLSLLLIEMMQETSFLVLQFSLTNKVSHQLLVCLNHHNLLSLTNNGAQKKFSSTLKTLQSAHM
jgi:hypothetical protein